MSKHTLQTKRQKIRQSAKAQEESLDSARVISQLEAVDSQARHGDGLMQLGLSSSFSAQVCTRKGDKREQEEDEDEESDANVSAD
jgi:hypothetical protein